MKSQSKQEAINTISKFFSRKRFSKDELKKTRKLAMAHKLKLGSLRQFYCKSCQSQLKGRIRVSKTKKGTYKTILCKSCNFRNKFKI